MKFVDEFRDPAAARKLLAAIEHLAGTGGENFKFMEVCGGHTHTIYRHGIEHLLPDNVERTLVAIRAQQLGAGIAPPPKADFNLSQALRRIVEDPAMRHAAEAFAARYRGLDRGQILPKLVDRALALIRN